MKGMSFEICSFEHYLGIAYPLTMPSASNIVQLRELIAQRFPSVLIKSGCLPTGIPSLDAHLQGGLGKGCITEFIHAGAGGALVLVSLLRAAASANRRVALIDGLDSFDPQPLEAGILSNLLWVRCQTAAQAMRAGDLLLRDGNLPLVLLDLCRNPSAQLRKIPSTNWYRLQRVVEQTSTAFVAFTPSSMIGGARRKLLLRSRFTLDAIDMDQKEILEQVEFSDAWERGKSMSA